jgi:hypothetical protein
MAEIIGSERVKDHMIFHLKVNIEEVKQLGGCVNDIRLVPAENALCKTSVYEKGRKGSAKFFLIPKGLRKDIELQKEASCLRIVTKDKVMWSYFMDR